jgi:hypothetical protein
MEGFGGEGEFEVCLCCAVVGEKERENNILTCQGKRDGKLKNENMSSYELRPL